MLFHDRETVNIAEAVRYIITYNPALDPTTGWHRTLSGGHLHGRLIHVRIRNTANIVLRAAYLQGPYTLCVSVRESTFHASREDDAERGDSPTPIYDQDVKSSTSFWAELAADKTLVHQGDRRLTVDARGSLKLHPRQSLPMHRQHSLSPSGIPKKALGKQPKRMN